MTGDTYISWAINNTGPNTLNYEFYVYLYFDDVIVERWRGEGLSTNYYSFIDGWDELPSRVRVQSGLHTLRLVVDSTNLVPEKNENDNVYERVFMWESTGAVVPELRPAPTRLPDLEPFAPEEWGAPVVATSYPGSIVDGPLSVSTPSYIRYSIHNAGLSSTPEDVWVHLFLDDVLVEIDSWSGVLADGFVERPEWSELFEITNVTPAAHTLKIVVDPGDLIAELNEDNNSFEKEFTWGSGPVPPIAESAPEPVPTPPVPLTLPNLVPGWEFGWDGPIIASHEPGTFQDDLLTVDETLFVDVVVFNESSIGAADPFYVDLFFDDEKIETFEFSGPTQAEELRWWEDWGLLPEGVDITEGSHTLRIVIDPENSIEEANEDDNVYEKTPVWATGTAPEPVQVTYSEEDLRAMVNDLQALLDVQGPAIGPDGADYSEEVLSIADAGYFLVAGRSIVDERVEISLLARDDYLAWIDDSYVEDFAVDDGSGYPSILARREHLKRTTEGIKTRRYGEVAIVVDAGQDIAAVLNALAHELGHMLQGYFAPRQTEAESSHYLNAVQEAQAQQFERVFWLSLEEFTGLTLLTYPDYEGFQNLVDDTLDYWIDGAEHDEHSLGALLQWLAVFDDPELEDLMQELDVADGLSASSALVLYEYLVDLAPASVQRYVAARLQVLDTVMEAVRVRSKARLVSGLHPDNEGSAHLRVPALLTS